MFDIAHTAPPADVVIATIDGAARGNPGPAAIGVVFQNEKGRVLARLSGRLANCTNNVAEYSALLAALVAAREKGWRALKVRTDSELLARQLQGRYKVKSPDLKPLHQEARQLVSSFDYFAVEAVPRKLTRAADKLANAALDGRPVGAKSERSGDPALLAGRRPASGGRLAKAPPSLEAPASEKPKTIRAIYQNGALKPLEPLELPEGAEVEILLRPRKA